MVLLFSTFHQLLEQVTVELIIFLPALSVLFPSVGLYFLLKYERAKDFHNDVGPGQICSSIVLCGGVVRVSRSLL